MSMSTSMKRIDLAAVAFVAAIFTAGLASAEQDKTGQQHGGQPTGNAHATNTAGAVSDADKQFMMKAASGGIAEVELARLALKKSNSPEVKKHAQHMIDDHTKANDELKGIASSKGVSLPTEPDAKHKQVMTKLEGLSGDAFDKEYIKSAGVEAHKEMQALFKQQTNIGQDAEVKAFATKTLPVVEEHLTHSQKLADVAGASTDAAGSRGEEASHQRNTGSQADR
jgi:putative membrane protein